MKEFFKKLFAHKHRKYKRHRVHDGLTVTLDSDSTPGDQIVDIGLGGLTFNYVDRGQSLSETFKIDIYVDDDLHMEQLKVKLISNIEVGDVSYSSKNIRRISVQFLSLTPVQDFDLKALIKSHGIEI